MEKIPVILDTDIGGDIDDTWGLALLLSRPELDLKLITISSKTPNFSAKVAAKFCQCVNRCDVTIGIGFRSLTNSGKPEDKITKHQRDWVEDYDISAYPGKISYDAVGAIIETIRKSDTPVTLIAIGPASNLAEAVNRAPDIANKVKVKALFGSIYKGYDGPPCAEYNVWADIPAAKRFFEGFNDITISPLDTCFDIPNSKYQFARLLEAESKNPLVKSLIENCRVWCKNHPRWNGKPCDNWDYICDTVAVYLAYSEKLVNIETLPISVTNDGKTPIDNGKGKSIRAAVSWKDNNAFVEHIINSLLEYK